MEAAPAAEASTEEVPKPIRLATRVDDVAAATIAPQDRANALHVCCLGLVTVLSRQYYGWNVAFTTGFLPFAISQLVMALTYVVYVSCAAEVCGKIAFSGGVYGLSRVTLGYYVGYMVGCLELLEYIAASSVSVVVLGRFLKSMLNVAAEWELLIWLLLYLVCIGCVALPGRCLWPLVVFLAGLSLLPSVLFIGGAISFAHLDDFGVYMDGTRRVWASGTIVSAYLAWLPYTTWAYAGIECLSLITDMTATPKTTVPTGMLYCLGLLVLSNMAIVCLGPSLPPGIATAATAAYPLTIGLGLAYDLSASASAWLLVPAHVGSALGFLLPSGRLVQALADSSLLPPWLGLKNAGYAGRWKAVTIASMFGYVLCLLSYFFRAFSKAMPHLAVLAACGCYAAQLVGFILLRTSYKAESNGYRSPFGIGSAVLAIGSFALLAVSILGGCQDDDGVAALTCLAYLVVASVYYYVACKDRQTVSKDEYASIFRFTIIKFNNMKRRLTRQNQRKSSQWTKVISLLQSTSTLSSSNRVSYVDVGVNRGSRLSQAHRLSTMAPT